jgi:uncharacterized OB-fold protein
VITLPELVDQYGKYAVDPDNEAFFRGLSEGWLRMKRCDGCGKLRNPPLPTCPHCWSGDATDEDVDGRGQVFLLTWLHRGGPILGLDPPYPVVTVELDAQQGLRYTTIGVNCSRDTLHIGAHVEPTWVSWNGARVLVVEPGEARP